MVTLYIATHNKTGLKYFGKSERYLTEEELQSKYHGSGSLWKRHLEEFGDDVTMKVIGTYELETASKIALKFSEENDIVQSKEWANLIPEDCYVGGGDPKTGLTYEEYYGKERAKEIKAKLSRVKSTEERQKISEALTNREGPNKGKQFSSEWKQKMSLAASERERSPLSEETKRKISEAKKGKPSSMLGKKHKIVICPHCNKEGAINGMKQWHFDNCKMKDKDEF
jgi:hypothetical protein